MKASSFLFGEGAHLWWAYDQIDSEDANKGHVKTWSKIKELFYKYFLLHDCIKNMKERLKDFKHASGLSILIV